MGIKIATDQALYCESAVVDAFPFTLSCMFQVNDISGNHPLMWVGDKDLEDYCCWLEARGTVAEDPLRLLVHKHETANYRQLYQASFAAQTWHHGLAGVGSTTIREVGLDGVINSEDGLASGTPAGYDRTALGALLDSSPTFRTWQILAEAAIWKRILESWESAALAKGYSPLFFLDGLVAYWPLGGRFGQNYRDIVGGHELTAMGTPEWTAHPPGIIYPDDPELGEYRVQEGPYRVAAGELSHTGAAAGDVFHTGAAAGRISG